MLRLGCGQSGSESVRSESLEQRGQAKVGVAIGVVVILLLLLVVCAVVAGFLVIPRLAGDEQVLLAFPSRSGDAELYLLNLGQDRGDGVLLAEDVERASMGFWLLKDEIYQGWGSLYGGFVPDSDRLLLWYDLDDETVIQQMRVGDKEPAKVIESGAELRWGNVVNDFEFLFLEESRDGEERCYVAMPGGEAERVAKAERCSVSLGGAAVYFSEVDGGETTLSVTDINGENEAVLLDEVEGVDSYRVSADGSHAAYVQEDGGEYQLYLIERGSGKEDGVSDEVSLITDYGFVPDSDILYYIVREDADDQELQLYTSEGNRPIAEGVAIDTGASVDGRYLAYTVEDKDGEETLYVHPVRGDDDVEVADGEDIEFGFILAAPSRLVVLITEEGSDEFKVLSASPDGSDVVELLSEDDATFDRVVFVSGEPTLYIYMEGEDGQVLFVTPANKATGFRLLEGWASIELLNRSSGGRSLVFWAAEEAGDDPVLYSVAVQEGADAVELDDDGEEFLNAVFTSDGQFVLYTADTGNDDDDVEVRRVRVDGEEKFETLYDEAILVDVRWDDINPF